MKWLIRSVERAWAIAKSAPISDEIADIMRQEMKEIDRHEILSGNVDPEWHSNRLELRRLLLGGDVARFLQWDVIRKTMLVGLTAYTLTELRRLRQQRDWSTRWFSAAQENWIGAPTPYLFFPRSSANLIHHLYHWSVLEESSQISVGEYESVLEFGGGYGSLCRAAHTLGFSGQYIIFDLPEFSSLQRFYLRSLGIPLIDLDSYRDGHNGVLCISEKEVLEQLLRSSVPRGRSLFVATWSLSEVPIALRREWTDIIVKYSDIIVAYQAHFAGMDNVKFFAEWDVLRKYELFNNRRINHMPGHYYLTTVS